jgi:hypothetical protein
LECDPFAFGGIDWCGFTPDADEIRWQARQREEKLDEGAIAYFQEEEAEQRYLEAANSGRVVAIKSQKDIEVIDKIVNEPVGGAHRDSKLMASQLKRGLNDAWRQVADLKLKELLDRRYERLQSYGRYTDTKVDAR